MTSSLILIFLLTYSLSSDAVELSCGMSEGYAPFQYVHNGKEKGVDLEIVRIFNKIGPHRIKVTSGKWDNLVAELYHIRGIDCLIGMGITEKRKEIFKFSRPVYKRRSSIVALKSRGVTRLEDLKGGVVCGDKDSEIEYEIINLSNISIRVIYKETKELCMRALKKGEVIAAIIPEKVGKYFSRMLGTDIVTILKAKKSVDIGFAFKLNDPINLNEFNSQLKKTVKTKKIRNLIKKSY